MLYKSHFSVKAAVTNQSGVVKADTISKNVRSLKNQKNLLCKKILLAALFSVTSLVIYAQKLSGSLAPLKEQKEVNVVLDFSDILVNNMTEEEYIVNETKDLDEENKELWLANWNDSLRSRCYKNLTGDLNKYNKRGILGGKYSNAEYTIYVKVIHIQTGIALKKMGGVEVVVNFLKTGEPTSFATVSYGPKHLPASDLITKLVARVANPFRFLGGFLAREIRKSVK